MKNECQHFIMVSINKNYFILFLISLLYDKINEQYLIMTGKPFLSTLRKCITDFHCILVAKLASRLIIFLSSDKNIKLL